MMRFCFDIADLLSDQEFKSSGNDEPTTVWHVTNPVAVPESSDLHAAQPLTFASMHAAARQAGGDIHLGYTAFPEDADAADSEMTDFGNLQQSLLDFSDYALPASRNELLKRPEFDELRMLWPQEQLAKVKKLPLVGEITSKALDRAEDDDLVVYTNVDIGVMPHFYQLLRTVFAAGLDGLVINRRTVPAALAGTPLSVIYSHPGLIHPGFDCFVAPARIFRELDFGSTVIGAELIGRVILYNMLVNCQNAAILTNAHLTFHLGDDRSWMQDVHEHSAHNFAELNRIVNRLASESPEAAQKIARFGFNTDPRLRLPPLEELFEALEKNPEAVEFSFSELGQSEDAITALKPLQTWWKDQPQSWREEHGQTALIELAQVLHSDAYALTFIGLELIGMRDFNQAMDCFSRALFLEKALGAARLGMALVLEEQGMHNAANEQLSKGDVAGLSTLLVGSSVDLLSRIQQLLDERAMEQLIADMVHLELLESTGAVPLEALADALKRKGAAMDAMAVNVAIENLDISAKEWLPHLFDIDQSEWAADDWKLVSGLSGLETVKGMPARWVAGTATFLLPVNQAGKHHLKLYGLAVSSREAVSNSVLFIDGERIDTRVNPWMGNGFVISAEHALESSMVDSLVEIRLQSGAGQAREEQSTTNSILLAKLEWGQSDD